MSEIIDFFRGVPNRNGIKLTEMLNWDDKKLEHTHDYIQFMFPIPEPSYFNRNIPKLTEEDIAAFKEGELSNILQANLVTAFRMIIHFWGFQIGHVSSGYVKITKSKDFDNRSKNWATGKNHNHLRMSRVMHCLTTLGLSVFAKGLYQALMEVNEENPKAFNPHTIAYWETHFSEI